jgi:hypothetical protein
MVRKRGLSLLLRTMHLVGFGILTQEPIETRIAF